MLSCVFHPIDPMRVVEDDEAKRMIETGFWFDCPKKALNYRNQVAENIKNETKAESKKDKAFASKIKKEGAIK